MPSQASSSSPRLTPLPVVYSCSGCSSAAQMANYMAVRLDRTGVAEMSCIAGVGGDVPALLKVAKSGRPIIAIDGCPLQCVKHTLARHAIAPTMNVVLSDAGVKRIAHTDFDQPKADAILSELVSALPGYLSGESSATVERAG